MKKNGKKIYPKVFLCTYVAIITYNYFKYLYNYFFRVVIFFESNVRPLREYIYIYTHIRENIDKSKDFQIRDGFVDIGCKSC